MVHGPVKFSILLRLLGTDPLLGNQPRLGGDGTKHRGCGCWEEKGDSEAWEKKMKASSEDRIPKEERPLAPPGSPSPPALAPVVRKPD